MSEREDEDAVVSKKFKPSNENSVQTCNWKNKHELFTTSNPEKEAGAYYLGPIVKKYVRAPVTQCLARKKKTDDYYSMKILELNNENNSDKCSFMKRSIFHNEFSILSLLVNQPGVIQLQDFFKEYIRIDDGGEKNVKLNRVCMVLECLIPHSHYNTEYIPLNHYLKEDRLSENEALHIFYNLLVVLKDLHKRNVVHRDIRLSNIILNRKTLNVKLIDFYYAKLLPSDAVSKYYQCRNYSSPEFVGTQQVSPKANDMWSAGIILYAMLNGCMPFAGASNYVSFFSANRSLHEFYLKIMENDCTITNNICISDGTKDILKNILCKVPQFRLTASEAMDMVSSALAVHYSSHSSGLNGFGGDSDQIVPDIPGLVVEVGEDSTSKSQSLNDSVVEPEVMEREEDSNRPPARVESVIKLLSDYQRTTIPSRSPRVCSETCSETYSGLASRDLKYAMLRLGVTSINNINALCFAYYTRDPC